MVTSSNYTGRHLCKFVMKDVPALGECDKAEGFLAYVFMSNLSLADSSTQICVSYVLGLFKRTVVRFLLWSRAKYAPHQLHSTCSRGL